MELLSQDGCLAQGPKSCLGQCLAGNCGRSQAVPGMQTAGVPASSMVLCICAPQTHAGVAPPAWSSASRHSHVAHRSQGLGHRPPPSPPTPMPHLWPGSSAFSPGALCAVTGSEQSLQAPQQGPPSLPGQFQPTLLSSFAEVYLANEMVRH